ncbi:uncharacterized protein VTP21DRAFT_1330 [Calcarisporiella thermophila]|uniref:uncharacterized protein n=1 Tax=Calcarisporiella thermophila TaxID=911321 RepID=UPI003742ED60
MAKRISIAELCNAPEPHISQKGERASMLSRNRGHLQSATFVSKAQDSSEDQYTHTAHASSPSPQEQPSRLHQFTMQVGHAVSAGAAVLSEQGMRNLRYCLEWLQYAISQIEYQIASLRELLSSLSISSTASQPSTAIVPHTLNTAKRDVVEVLRRVVEVVSRYAGQILPENARRHVRSFILSLPSRWTQLNHQSGHPYSSPSLGRPSTEASAPSSVGGASDVEATRRVLNLATESANTLRSVKSVLGDTLYTAELWLGKGSSCVSQNGEGERAAKQGTPMSEVEKNQAQNNTDSGNEDEEEDVDEYTDNAATTGVEAVSNEARIGLHRRRTKSRPDLAL